MENEGGPSLQGFPLLGSLHKGGSSERPSCLPPHPPRHPHVLPGAQETAATPQRQGGGRGRGECWETLLLALGLPTHEGVPRGV